MNECNQHLAKCYDYLKYMDTGGLITPYILSQITGESRDKCHRILSDMKHIGLVDTVDRGWDDANNHVRYVARRRLSPMGRTVLMMINEGKEPSEIRRFIHENAGKI